MSQVKTLTPVREKPWDWVTNNEYEEVTVRMQSYIHGHYRHKFDERDYDIYDPRYTRVRSSDWEAFRDPKKLWYTTYTANRKKMSDEVSSIFERARQLRLFERVNPDWKRFAAEFYVPLRHFEYSGAVQLQHVVRYAMGCPIEQAATFNAFDKQGRAQWLSIWALEMTEYEGTALLEAGNELWCGDPAYRKLREYMEQVLITDDWAEVLLAVNLAVDPLVAGIAYRLLAAVGVQHGDTVLPGLGIVCDEQVKWQEQWSRNLFEMLAKDPARSRWEYLKALGYEGWQDYRWGRVLSDPRLTPEESLGNLEIIAEWVNKWIPAAIDAVLPLQEVFARNGIGFSVGQAVNRVIEQDLAPYFTKIGVSLPARVGGVKQE